ncbi:MAG TPA: AzlD domain-containing protein [Frankiaceae bacterium]|nr:AzlD domain-containing protein [Frankiaceae bacterium]
MSWTVVLIACATCYVLKLAGLSVPARLLEDQRLQRLATTLPVALLAALIALQTWTSGHHLVIDARMGGVAVGAAAVLVRAPFIVVVALAALTAALLRLM